MPFNDYFIFDGEKSTDYGLYMASDPNAIHPARRGELFPIPGRNGSIVREDGSYDTYTQTYDVLLDSNMISTDVYAHAREVAAWLLGSRGFCRLEDSYEPEYFRLARCAAQMNVENRLARFGRAQIPFECQPQRYLKSGESAIRVQTFPDTGGGQIDISPIPQSFVSMSVTGATGEYRDKEKNVISTFTTQTAIPQNAYHVTVSWVGHTSADVIKIFGAERNGESILLAAAVGANPVIYNPTQFEARPLLKFVDTAQAPSPTTQTLTMREDVYIGTTGDVSEVVDPSSLGVYQTSSPVAVTGSAYAILTGNGYAFLDNTGKTKLGGFIYTGGKNFEQEKIGVPSWAESIVVSSRQDETTALSLQEATPNPGLAAATINGTSVNIDFATQDTIYLDCDLHDAHYADGTNANSAVSFSSSIDEYPTFPGLSPGENTIYVSDSYNLNFEIVPRWWTL